jgi:cytochrome c5
MLEKARCVAVMLILFSSLCGCGKTTAPATVAPENAAVSTEDTKQLFEKSCSVCHPISRVEQYSGKDPWKDIVDRMIVKHGAKVSAEDAGRIVAYLDKTYPRK